MLSHFPVLNSIEALGYSFPVTTVFAFLNIVFFFVIALIGAKKMKLHFPAMFLMVLLTFAISNIVSRAIFIFSRLFLHHDFESQGRVFYFYTNQKVSFGFLLAVFLAVWIGKYVYDLKSTAGRHFDVLMLAYLSLFWGRLGGALTRYHPGKITDSSWGTFYLGHYRHEPSLYEAVSLLLIFVIAVLAIKKIRIGGLLALLIVAWVSLSRVITDFFRSDDLASISSGGINAFRTSNFHLSSGLTLNQLAYLCLFLVAVFGDFRLTRKTEKAVSKN